MWTVGDLGAAMLPGRLGWFHPTPEGCAFPCVPVSGTERWSLTKVLVVFREFVVSSTRLETQHFPFLSFLFFTGVVVRPV